MKTNFFLFFTLFIKSVITIKPIPPIKIKIMTGINTQALPEKHDKFEKLGVVLPIGSIPALQKAATAKNKDLNNPELKLPVYCIMLGRIIKNPINSQMNVVNVTIITVFITS